MPSYNLTQQYIGRGIIQHILQWSIPFSWLGFPITGYTISINNHGNGDTSIIIKSNTSLSHTHTTDDGYCYRLDFSLAASNTVGRGEGTVIHAGNPIGKIVKGVRTTTAKLLVSIIALLLQLSTR